ncbi:twin-arginine translocase TatA/TatE family subunit [Hymenobacter sp. H14-R3]|uniref:Sec-independent protein translocase subunit TatA/TatB n=1 Tax=Hymenobacter sp. H14-R3 TaxID=3046308 RepID=UPI0032D94C23
MQSPLLFLGDIGGSELILIMVVILIFFGANKIPELARGLGKGIREFKDASSEIRNEFERAGQPNANQNYNPNQAYNPNQGQGYNPNQAQGYNPNQPQGYDPNQPYQPQNQDYSQQPAPYQPAPASGDYVAPVADYTAPAAVDLPAAAQPTYHQSTPIPPTTDGIPGTRPRLDQP